MEVKESERTVIAKPVASRPCGPSFRSFTDLLNDDSSHSVPVIRPKTVSFKPTVNRATISTGGLTSSQAEILSDKVDSKSDGKPAATTATNTSTVVYKPLAKLVSKTTVSLLASMANFNNKSTPNKQAQAPPPPPRRAESTAREASKGHNCKSTRQDLDNDDDDDNDTTNTNNDKSVAASDARALSSSSYDGYNWRKYGQKQVKGSEYPRSYYKCTHPGCPVKKKVERSLDGQIAEIVYKAEHNHSKPQPANNYNKRTTTGSAANSLPERTSADQACSEGNDRVSEIGLARICSYNYRGVVDDKNNNEIGRCRDNSVVVVEAAEEQGLMMTSKGINIEADDDQEDYDQARSSKRRKGENNQLSSIAEAEAQECRVVVQNLSDPEVSGDGFRWRKYGQKVVKGNPYPRSYYRCTSLKCNMRKHVERASDDPKAFITTYEGKHNHEMPIKNPNNNNNINNNSHTD